MSADAVTVDAALVESVDALKTRGNGLFSAGDSAGAITVYGEALAQLGESPRRGELAGSLLQNRALCKRKVRGLHRRLRRGARDGSQTEGLVPHSLVYLASLLLYYILRPLLLHYITPLYHLSLRLRA
jgi:hypothetical protein